MIFRYCTPLSLFIYWSIVLSFVDIPRMEEISINNSPPGSPTSSTTPTPRTPTSPTSHPPRTPTSPNPLSLSSSSTPATPTFLISDISQDPSFAQRSPQHQPSPRIQRTFAQRLGQLAYEKERGGLMGEERESSSNAVLDINPEGEGIRRDRGGERVGEVERERGGREELLSTSEDIFVIPPQMSIDEKLFQDEVILWSHYVKLSDSFKQPQSVSLLYLFLHLSIFASCIHSSFSLF